MLQDMTPEAAISRLRAERRELFKIIEFLSFVSNERFRALIECEEFMIENNLTEVPLFSKITELVG
jgi:hypothetical protein